MFFRQPKPLSIKFLIFSIFFLISSSCNCSSFYELKACKDFIRRADSSPNWSADYEPSIFRIYKIDSGETEGTATLIDKRGIFLTAAHVVADPKNLRLSSSKKILPRAIDSRIEVLVEGAPGTSVNTVSRDWALIRALDWSKSDTETLLPIPVRYTITETNESETTTGREVSGRFFGFQYGDEEKDLISNTFTMRSDGLGSGDVFRGMSGSLLLDENGWGFGLVGAWGNPELSRMNEEDRREWLFRASTFGFALIGTDSSSWIEYIDPDETYSPDSSKTFKELLNRLEISKSHRDFLNALKLLFQRYPDIDLFKIEYYIKAYPRLTKKEFLSPDTSGRLLLYFIQNAANRCMPPSGFERVLRSGSDQLSNNDVIDLGKWVGNRALAESDEDVRYLAIKASELLLNRGLTSLASRGSPTSSTYRSNVAVALAKFQTELIEREGIRAVERAISNLRLAKSFDVENRSISVASFDIAIKVEDWESAAFFLVDAEKHAPYRRESSQIESINRSVVYLGMKDAAANGVWGTRIIETEQPVAIDKDGAFEFRNPTTSPTPSAVFRQLQF